MGRKEKKQKKKKIFYLFYIKPQNMLKSWDVVGDFWIFHGFLLHELSTYFYLIFHFFSLFSFISFLKMKGEGGEGREQGVEKRGKIEIQETEEWTISGNCRSQQNDSLEVRRRRRRRRRNWQHKWRHQW